MESGVVPEDRQVVCIVSVYKGKGDKRDCANCKGIGVLSIPGKIYGRVLINRMIESTKEQVAEEQGGSKIRGSLRNPDEAIRAVETLNRKFMLGRPIYLSLVN